MYVSFNFNSLCCFAIFFICSRLFRWLSWICLTTNFLQIKNLLYIYIDCADESAFHFYWRISKVKTLVCILFLMASNIVFCSRIFICSALGFGRYECSTRMNTKTAWIQWNQSLLATKKNNDAVFTKEKLPFYLNLWSVSWCGKKKITT